MTKKDCFSVVYNMSHVVDETTAEGERFNFNRWLIDNELLTLKKLFIKHGATNATTLQISSPEMQRLMVDPDFLSQPQMVPKIVMATHHLDIVEKIVTVVLSEKEQEVIDRIKRGLKSADQIEEEMNQIKVEYPRSRERFNNLKNKELETVTAQINEKFDALFAALRQRKQELLKQLNETVRDFNHDHYTELLSEWTENINDSRAFLKDNESKCDNLISATMDNMTRKNKILLIGQHVEDKAESQLICCGSIMEDMQDDISRNNDSEFRMHFMLQEGIEKELIASIKTLGTISEPIEEQITPDIDPEYDALKFEHRPVRVWRYDIEQRQWRGRGKGTVSIYGNDNASYEKLVYIDENHNEVRLLQWINGKELCKYSEASRWNQSEVEWIGADYAMDQQKPILGKWRMKFMDNGEAATVFMKIFNQIVHENIFCNEPLAFFVGMKCSSSMGSSVPSELCESDDEEQKEAKTKYLVGGKCNDCVTMKDSAADDEGNMMTYTLESVVQLEEVNVNAEDNQLDSFEIVKLYRWGKDALGDDVWNCRASNASIDFWQQPNKGKVRVICRDNVTNKLRMNHWLPQSTIANAELRAGKFVQWSGFDTTIHAEDKDDNNGFCRFNCEFRDGETAQKFYDLLVESIYWSTFKPIVQLEEVNVAAGTEGESQVGSFEIVKLYRSAKNKDIAALYRAVMMHGGDRARNTTVDFWQQPNKGKVRVICRESVTCKLRMNHWLPASDIANVLLRAEKFVQWNGFDTTIHAEDKDDHYGFCRFNCEFRDGETAQKFYDVLLQSIENNEKIVGNGLDT